MSIEQAIHERWGDYRPLENALPPYRLFTGSAPPKFTKPDGTEVELSFPFLTLERQGDTARTRTSHRTIERAIIRFNAWGETLDQVKPIAKAVTDYFNREEFETSGLKIRDCKPGNVIEVEDDAGAWHAMVDVEFNAEETR